MHTQWCQFSERTVSISIISSILPKQIYKRIWYHIKPKFFKSYIEAICISIELAVLHFRMKPLLQKAILHARIQLYGCTEDLWKGKLKWLRKTTKKGTELSTSKNPGGLSSKLWKVRWEKTGNKVQNVNVNVCYPR